MLRQRGLHQLPAGFEQVSCMQFCMHPYTPLQYVSIMHNKQCLALVDASAAFDPASILLVATPV